MSSDETIGSLAVVIPGSGAGELEGIFGSFRLTVEDDGTHHYAPEYAL